MFPKEPCQDCRKRENASTVLYRGPLLEGGNDQPGCVLCAECAATRVRVELQEWSSKNEQISPERMAATFELINNACGSVPEVRRELFAFFELREPASRE